MALGPPQAGLAVGREEASSQATKGCGGRGRPLATSTQGKAEGGDAVCNTHETMAQAAISQFVKVIALQECLTNPVTEMRPTGVPEHTQQVRNLKTTREGRCCWHRWLQGNRQQP